MSIIQIADRLVEKLSAEGFTIQRYESHTTNSVYLKLDYGVCNTIRISDHHGKKHLKYMYNLLTCHKGNPECIRDGFTRYYYKANHAQTKMMLHHIKSNRQKKIARFGTDGYLYKMETSKRANAYNRKGFWSQAELVYVGRVVEEDDQYKLINQGVIEW